MSSSPTRPGSRRARLTSATAVASAGLLALWPHPGCAQSVSAPPATTAPAAATAPTTEAERQHIEKELQ
jgi:hypothetical protein